MWIRYNLVMSLVLMCYSNQHMLERNHKLIIEIMFKASRCFHKMNPTQNVSITFAQYETYSNVQPLYNHLGLKFTSTSQVAAHIVSEQEQKPTGISDCRHLQFHWSSMTFSTVRRNRSSGGFNQFRSEKLVPYIYIYSYLFIVFTYIFIYILYIV